MDTGISRGWFVWRGNVAAKFPTFQWSKGAGNSAPFMSGTAALQRWWLCPDVAKGSFKPASRVVRPCRFGIGLTRFTQGSKGLHEHRSLHLGHAERPQDQRRAGGNG